MLQEGVTPYSILPNLCFLPILNSSQHPSLLHHTECDRQTDRRKNGSQQCKAGDINTGLTGQMALVVNCEYSKEDIDIYAGVDRVSWRPRTQWDLCGMSCMSAAVIALCRRRLRRPQMVVGPSSVELEVMWPLSATPAAAPRLPRDARLYTFMRCR